MRARATHGTIDDLFHPNQCIRCSVAPPGLHRRYALSVFAPLVIKANKLDRLVFAQWPAVAASIRQSTTESRANCTKRMHLFHSVPGQTGSDRRALESWS
jgi:hypothetical protein